MFNATNNDFQKLTRAFYSFVEDKSYLFQHKAGVVTVQDYIEFVNRDLGHKDLKCFYVPIAYSLDVLDQFKDKVVCTSYHVGPMGRQYYSIIQVNPETHLLVMYSLDDEQFAAIIDFMVADANYFTEFVKNNKQFAIHKLAGEVKGFAP